MEYSVPLAVLPPQLVFPEHLRDRIRYEPQQQRLAYRGFMTKRAFDELAALSDDLTYHRALEQLFVLTSAELAPPAEGHHRWVAGAAMVVAAGLVLVGLAVWRWQGSGSHARPAADRQVSVAPHTEGQPHR